MKLKTICSGLLLTATLALAGCSVVGSDPVPPTKFEQAIFTTQTNWVNMPVKVLVTNQVELVQTNTVLRTNEIGLPVPVQLTNVVTVPQYDLVTVTQAVAQYTLTPSDTTKGTVQAGGSIVNTFLPGVGSLVGGILMGVLGMWGKLRSAKTVGSTLAQNIETIREFVKTLPDGAKYDKIIVEYLQAHQNETGAAQNILAILSQYVSNTEAKGAVVELQSALASLR